MKTYFTIYELNPECKLIIWWSDLRVTFLSIYVVISLLVGFYVFLSNKLALNISLHKPKLRRLSKLQKRAKLMLISNKLSTVSLN